MSFVNTIALLVHSEITLYLGGPNKNVGDAFLLVWRYRSQHYSFENEDVKLKDLKVVRNQADCALYSMMNMICQINRQEEILEFNKNKKILDKMPSFYYMLDFKVKLGCGLH